MNAKAESGATALATAALYGHLAIVNQLLAAAADVSAADADGATALMMAAAQGQAEIVNALVAKGADVNVKWDVVGTTPLMAAASAGRAAAVRALLSRKADVNAANSDGQTALMVAAYGGLRETSPTYCSRPAPTSRSPTSTSARCSWARRSVETWRWRNRCWSARPT